MYNRTVTFLNQKFVHFFLFFLFSFPPVPYSNANITFQLLSPEPVPRPGYNNFYNTPDLLEFVKATQIRIHLQGHYHVASPRHRYYGIDEVTISARCECNGHAVSCDLSMDPYVCNCLAASRTTGDYVS